jgi:hypothetical protein
MSTIHPVRSPRGDSRHSSVYATGSARLAAYLAAGVGGAMMATAHSDAGVVVIDLTNVGGFDITGPTPSGTFLNWLGAGTGTLNLDYDGLWGTTGLEFAVNGTSFASPRNFGLNASIGSAVSNFTTNFARSQFDYYISSTGGQATSPDFGAGSFMGFRFGSGSNWNYGYLEVTWDSATEIWEILSGAYESTVNTAILAGATPPPPPPPIPAPSALALLALGGGAFRRARARAA